MQALDKIAAVVVTHNRLELLKECLAGIRAQRRVPDMVFIVNNGSTDGTREFLDSETGVTVIHQANLGGAGGFFTGFKAAYEWGADAIWCMDDDTIPYSDTLFGLLQTATSYVALGKDMPLGWVGSVVQWIDGSMHAMNRPSLVTGSDWLGDCLRLSAVPAQSSSYVSILFTREALYAGGYPLAEMFIWGDDVEHTQRIARGGFAGLVSFASPCLHKTKANASTNLSYLAPDCRHKYFYHFRNELYLARRIGVCTAFQRFCYLLFSLLRKGKFFSLGVFVKATILSLFFNPTVKKPATP